MCFGLWHTDVVTAEKSVARFVRVSCDIMSRDSSEAIDSLGSGESLACRIYATVVSHAGGSRTLPEPEIRPHCPACWGVMSEGKAALDSPAGKRSLWCVPLIAEKAPLMVPIKVSLIPRNQAA